ncbi:MAG: peptidoglycan bridge formation glycyltransferase FemA/FemB family protein [Spirochaetales bacterium]|nr:peptidoglycan bridge formation glycyltransferase FemA/FemB family protein [Spirochaetales bacterium]
MQNSNGSLFTFTVEKSALSLCDNNQELLQTGFWGKHKKHFGWLPEAFHVSTGDDSKDFCLLTLTRVFKGRFAFTYIPFGPQIAEPEDAPAAFLSGLACALLPHLEVKPIFIRFDLPWGRYGINADVPVIEKDRRIKVRVKGRIVKAPLDVQPASTVILPINVPLDDILAGMKPKTRYNIRLALKKGVAVSETGVEGLSSWYGLYRETAERDRIAIHSFEYYRYLFELLDTYGKGAPLVRLFLAVADKELLAGIIVAVKDDYAWYLYGASSGKKRNYMPSYALQWRAIQFAKENGCKFYDFFGIPPFPDPGHPMYGLYRFKTGFGGKVLHRYGSYDFINRQGLYGLYRFGETARNIYFKKIKKNR